MKKILIIIFSSIGIILFTYRFIILPSDFKHKTQQEINSSKERFVNSYQATLDTQRAKFQAIYTILTSNKNFLKTIAYANENPKEIEQIKDGILQNSALNELIEKYPIDSINIFLASNTHLVGIGKHTNTTLPLGLKYSEGLSDKNELYQYFYPLFLNDEFIGTIEFSINFDSIIKQNKKILSSGDSLLITKDENQIQSVENKLKKLYPQISPQINEHINSSKSLSLAEKKYLIYTLSLQNTLGEPSGAIIHVEPNQTLYEFSKQHTVSIAMIIIGIVLFFINIILILRYKTQKIAHESKHNEIKNIILEENATLANENSFLNSVLQTIPLPVSLRDLDGNYILCNEPFAELFKIEHSKVVGKNIKELIDQEGLESTFGSDKYLLKIDQPIEYEHFVNINGKDTIFTIHKNLLNDGDKIIGILTAFHDVTQEKLQLSRVQELLDENERQKNSLKDDKKIIDQYAIFFKLDENEKILEASKAFLDTLGYKKEEIEERNIGEFCSLGEIAFGRFKKDEEHKNISSIITFRRKDGNQIWLDCTATQENNALQNDGVQIIFAQDVSNEVRIKELSNIDDLTQIYNRKKLNETLELTIEHLKTNKEKSASFILFDIDDFKRVNDVYGHLVGDFILKEISQLAKSHLNSRDTIARWGGEEFAIILQDASMQDALKNAQNIRNAIANHNFEHVEQITCSFGLTEFKDDDTQDSLIKRADDALYSSKNSGKNKIQFLG